MEIDAKRMTLGFVGTGTITEAVVTGLGKTRFRDTPIVVSPRSESVAARLAEANQNVSIALGNQDVLDRSDLVFVAVRPQIAEEVVRALRFRPSHHVISFVAAMPLDRLLAWIDQPLRLSQAIPLPFVADLQGATAIHPPDEVSNAVFSALGTAVQVESKREFDLLAVVSSMMGAYFGILDATSTWLESQGLPRAAGDAYLRQLFSGLAHAARSKPAASFDELVGEHSTKGGLNEQVLEDFRSFGGMAALQQALGRVLARIGPVEGKPC
ncbi:NAD(P)-binding domain-containing protein [Rhizobium sp. P32RR-XVIII]|uniref:pyrroline-5-carboxylate reductase n=1 Tax=Rhizobium sp. P32RR-XVIII TaxID=2726738 RepID=UPI0014572067|nr:pyrroline-5-carboxylate reductase [Rhizobium sp. P32RR-XVIII]NLS07675.1 NAD(P)-binding domain-containing protein [Rhizobium sp. P32RR-XVIII]